MWFAENSRIILQSSENSQTITSSLHSWMQQFVNVAISECYGASVRCLPGDTPSLAVSVIF